MQFETQHFGTIEYTSESVFDFPAGLPGFEQEHRFVAIEQPSTKPILFLQSLTRPDLCFITLPVLVVDPGYRLAIAPDDLRALGLAEHRQPSIGTEVLCLAIISVSEGSPPTANLLAPLVVNLKTRCAAQVIQSESGYPHRHALLAPGKEETCSSSDVAPASRF